MLKRLYNILTVIIVILGLTSCVLFVVMNLMGKVPRVIVSGSMEPGIKTGSVAFIDTKAWYDGIIEGDIIAFETDTKGMVLHRVKERTADGLETKGDANEKSDGITTTEENFEGKYMFSIPYLGYIVFALKSRRGVILGVTFIIAYIILGYILEDSKSNNEKEIKENKATS